VSSDNALFFSDKVRFFDGGRICEGGRLVGSGGAGVATSSVKAGTDPHTAHGSHLRPLKSCRGRQPGTAKTVR
jgi:hypothetical protein